MATFDWTWHSSTNAGYLIGANCNEPLPFSAILSPAQKTHPEMVEYVEQLELQNRTDSLDCEKHLIGDLLESNEESFCSEVSASTNIETPKNVTKKHKKPSVQKKILFDTFLPINLDYETLPPIVNSNRIYQHNASQINNYTHTNEFFTMDSDPYLPGQKFSVPPQSNICNSKTYSAMVQQPRPEQWNADNQLDFQRSISKPSSPSSNSSSSNSSATSVKTFGGQWNGGYSKPQSFQPKKFNSQSNLLMNIGAKTISPKSAKIPGLNPVDQRANGPKKLNEPKMLGKKQRSVGDFQLQMNSNNRKKRVLTNSKNELTNVAKHGSFSNFNSAFLTITNNYSTNKQSIESQSANKLRKRSESNNHLPYEKDTELKNFDVPVIVPGKTFPFKNNQKRRFEVLSSNSCPIVADVQKEQSHQRRSQSYDHQSANNGLDGSKKEMKHEGKELAKVAHPIIDWSGAGAKTKNLRKDSLEDASLPALTKNGLILILSNFLLFLASAFGSAKSGRKYSNKYAFVTAAGRRRNNGRVNRKKISHTSPALTHLYITYSTLWKALQIGTNWIMNLFVNFFVLLFKTAVYGLRLAFQNLLVLLYACWTKIYMIGRKLRLECLQLHRKIIDHIHHSGVRNLRKMVPGKETTEQSEAESDLTSSYTWSLEAAETAPFKKELDVLKSKSIQKNLGKKSCKQGK